MNVHRLDDVEGDLVTAVERVAGDASTALYEFSVAADEVLLLKGRAAIAFDIFAAADRSAPTFPAAAVETVPDYDAVGKRGPR